MSKTYIYLLVLVGVYLIIVKGASMGQNAIKSDKEDAHVSSSGILHGGASQKRTETAIISNGGGSKRR